MKKRFVITVAVAFLVLSGCGTRDLYGSESEDEFSSDSVLTTTSKNSDEHEADSTKDLNSENESAQTTPTSEEKSKTNNSSVPEVTTAPPQQDTKQQATAPATNPPQVNTPAQTTNTPKASTPKQTTTTKSKVSSEGKIAFQMKLYNSWQNQWGRDTYQYDIVLANYTIRDITEWEVKIPVPSDSRLVGSWNGSFSDTRSGYLTIKSDGTYVIPAKGTLNIGFQINLHDELTTIRNATLEAGGLTVYSKNIIQMP